MFAMAALKELTIAPLPTNTDTMRVLQIENIVRNSPVPELAMSVRSLYTYLDQGLFTARNIDLKRKPGFKTRKCHKTQITNRALFGNRLYRNFCELKLSSFVEMDMVHSSREPSKTLLTFFFTEEKLLLAFLINRCTKGAVWLVFDRLEKRMGTYGFLSVFEYILTDRGIRIRRSCCS